MFGIGVWSLEFGMNSRWCPRAHITENTEANFQIDVTFINKPHIWCLHSCLKNSQNYIPWHKNSIIYNIIVDTHCEKYCKWSDTNSETVGVLLTLEYHTAGKGSQPIRFKDQKELVIHTCVCMYNHILVLSNDSKILHPNKRFVT